MKKILLSCLIIFALVLSSCNQDVAVPPVVKEEVPPANEEKPTVPPVEDSTADVISIDTTQIGESSGWMTIDQDTKIKISNVADDEVFVMYINDPSSGRNIGAVASRAVSSPMIGGFNESVTGKQIIRTENGVASFSGLDAGVTGETTFKIERLKVKKVETIEDLWNTELSVFDYNGYEQGKVYIPNSMSSYYYVDEKVFSLNVNQIVNQLKNEYGVDDSLQKVVLTCFTGYYDAEMEEKYKEEGVVINHNTRRTYGFLVKENGEYKVMSEGVFDLTDIGNRVNLYAGLASDNISGSGLTLRILPVDVLELNKPMDVKKADSVFGLENLEKGKYVLKLSNLGKNGINSFTLQDHNKTEIRKYDGERLPVGLMLSYLSGYSDEYYYYLGEISGSVYINNMDKGDSVADEDGNYYRVELIRYEDVPECIKDKSFFDYKDNIAIGVFNSSSSSISEADNRITDILCLSEGKNVSSGNLSFVMTNVPQEKKYNVSFIKITNEGPVEVYDDKKYNCIIGFASTAHNMVENNLGVDNGNSNISFRFSGLEDGECIMAMITFSDR